MEALSPWHLALILLAVLLLFGYKKLPDASRSVGRSLRIFKSEMKGMHADDHREGPAPTPVSGEVLPAAAVAGPLESEADARSVKTGAADTPATQ